MGSHPDQGPIKPTSPRPGRSPATIFGPARALWWVRGETITPSAGEHRGSNASASTQALAPLASATAGWRPAAGRAPGPPLPAGPGPSRSLADHVGGPASARPGVIARFAGPRASTVSKQTPIPRTDCSAWPATSSWPSSGTHHPSSATGDGVVVPPQLHYKGREMLSLSYPPAQSVPWLDPYRWQTASRPY